MNWKRLVTVMLISLFGGLVVGMHPRAEPAWAPDSLAAMFSPFDPPFELPKKQAYALPFHVALERSPIKGERDVYNTLYLNGQHYFGLSSRNVILKAADGKSYRLPPGSSGTIKFNENGYITGVQRTGK